MKMFKQLLLLDWKSLIKGCGHSHLSQICSSCWSMQNFWFLGLVSFNKEVMLKQ